MHTEMDKIIEFVSAVRLSTIKRLELIPSGFENWAISKNSLTVAEIADHIIEADRWLMKKIADPSVKSFKAAKGKINIANRDEYGKLIDELKIWLDKKKNYLAMLTSERLDEKINDDRFGGFVTLWWVIVRGNLDHEIHHRGQLSSYIRVLQDQGVIPN